MRIAQLDLDDDFQEVFTRWGSHYTECHCGREHICIDSYGFSEYTPEEMDELRTRESEDEVEFHYEYDHVSVLELAGRQYVVGCKCEGWKPYMEFILNHRCEIRDFLTKIADKAEAALEHEKTFKVLKDYKFKVLDDPEF